MKFVFALLLLSQIASGEPCRNVMTLDSAKTSMKLVFFGKLIEKRMFKDAEVDSFDRGSFKLKFRTDTILVGRGGKTISVMYGATEWIGKKAKPCNFELEQFVVGHSYQIGLYNVPRYRYPEGIERRKNMRHPNGYVPTSVKHYPWLDEFSYIKEIDEKKN